MANKVDFTEGKALWEIYGLLEDTQLKYEIANNIVNNIRGLVPIVFDEHAEKNLGIGFAPAEQSPLVFNFYTSFSVDHHSPQLDPLYKKVRTIYKEILNGASWSGKNGYIEATTLYNFLVSLKEPVQELLKPFIGLSWDVGIRHFSNIGWWGSNVMQVYFYIPDPAHRVKPDPSYSEMRLPQEIPLDGTEVWGHDVNYPYEPKVFLV